MGTVAVLGMPKGVCAPCEIGSLGAFFETAWVPTTTLSTDKNLIRELVGVLDKQLLEALSARTAQEFEDVRQKVWPKYFRALRALQDTISNMLSEHQTEHIYAEAVVRIEADLEKQRVSRFGDTITEQAVFTLWTLGKIRSLAREICAAGEPPVEKKQADRDLLSDFCGNSWWSQFHLDILIAAMKFDRPIPEEIREAVCDGLRAAVNAFVIMKEALRLRLPHIEELPLVANLPWDDEDEGLLASSMKDRNANLADAGY
jgi:hypothetical protein